MKKSTLEIMGLIILEMFLLFLIYPSNPITSSLYENTFGTIIMTVAFFAIIYIPLFIIIRFKKSDTIFDPENLPEKLDPRFNVLYLELHQKHIAELEELRKKVKFFTAGGIIFLVISVICYLYIKSKPSSFFSIIEIFIPLIFMGIAGIFLNVASKYKKVYKKLYKEKIVASFINSLKQQLTYTPEDLMKSSQMERLYRMSGFEKQPFNIFEADDYISGNLGEDIKIKIADLCAKYETGTGKDRKVVVRFAGLYVITNCKTPFNTEIKISKNGVPIMKNYNLVELDNDEFERYFDVQSEDKILAVRLLTHDVMECLLDFYKKYKVQYEIIIQGDLINLRFFTGAMFEPKIFGSSMDRNLLYLYYLILKFVIDLTKTINKEIENFEI